MTDGWCDSGIGDDPSRSSSFLAFPSSWGRSPPTGPTAFGPGRPGQAPAPGTPSTPSTAAACWPPASPAPRGPWGFSGTRRPAPRSRSPGRWPCSSGRRRRPSWRGWSTSGAFRVGAMAREGTATPGNGTFFTGRLPGGASRGEEGRNGTWIANNSRNSLLTNTISSGVLKRRARRSTAFLFQRVLQISTGIFTDLSTAPVEKDGSESRPRRGFQGEPDDEGCKGKGTVEPHRNSPAAPPWRFAAMAMAALGLGSGGLPVKIRDGCGRIPGP